MGYKLMHGIKIFILRAFVTFVFTLCFALLFQFAESSQYDKIITKNILKKKRFEELQNATLNRIATNLNVTISLNVFDKLRHEIEIYNNEVSTVDKDKSWTFLKSFYFTITIVTTIGYGDVTPLTSAGMWLTIICALIGIPIMLLTLKSLGDFIHDTVQYFIKIFEVSVLKRITVEYLQSKTFIITFLLMWSLILIGAKMEQVHSGTSILEGIYAWFISMSTIGFGDFVVSKKYIQEEKNNNNNNNKSLGPSIGIFLFLILGLGVVASVINSVGEILETNEHLKRFLTICFGVGQIVRRKSRASSVTIGLKESSTICWRTSRLSVRRCIYGDNFYLENSNTKSTTTYSCDHDNNISPKNDTEIG